MALKGLVLCAAMTMLAAVPGFGTPLTTGAVISYSVNLVGNTGSTYIYTYSIYNDGTLPNNAPIQLFDIYFDPSLFNQNTLTILTPEPPQWSEDILFSVNPVTNYQDFAALDAEAAGAGIAPGSTLGGFSVEVTYLGQGTPGAQLFDVWNPASFTQPIETSTTVAAGSNVGSVPEPATALYLAGGLTLIGLWRLRQHRLSDSHREGRIMRSADV